MLRSCQVCYFRTTCINKGFDAFTRFVFFLFLWVLKCVDSKTVRISARVRWVKFAGPQLKGMEKAFKKTKTTKTGDRYAHRCLQRKTRVTWQKCSTESGKKSPQYCFLFFQGRVPHENINNVSENQKLLGWPKSGQKCPVHLFCSKIVCYIFEI